jgi:hypothetical protein
MAVKHFCDVCKEPYESGPEDFGHDPIRFVWEEWNLEVSAHVISEGAWGDICSKCLRKALGDFMMDLLCSNLNGDSDECCDR